MIDYEIDNAQSDAPHYVWQYLAVKIMLMLKKAGPRMLSECFDKVSLPPLLSPPPPFPVTCTHMHAALPEQQHISLVSPVLFQLKKGIHPYILINKK